MDDYVISVEAVRAIQPAFFQQTVERFFLDVGRTVQESSVAEDESVLAIWFDADQIYELLFYSNLEAHESLLELESLVHRVILHIKDPTAGENHRGCFRGAHGVEALVSQHVGNCRDRGGLSCTRTTGEANFDDCRVYTGFVFDYGILAQFVRFARICFFNHFGEHKLVILVFSDVV